MALRAIRRVLVLSALVALACASPGPAIRVDNAWARPVSGTAPGVTYLSIVNAGNAADRLLGVRSSCCAVVEIHETRVENDVMRMVPVDSGIAIEPGATVSLAPGGYHLMLFERAEPLRNGERFELTLDFEISEDVTIEVEVRGP